MTRRPAEDIRARALRAASECFRVHGVAGTSVDDIVQRSGIARATLYRHAGNREDVLLAVTLDEIERVRVELLRRLDGRGPVGEILVEAVLQAVDLLHDSPVLRQLLAEPALFTTEVSERAVDALVERLHQFVDPLFAVFADQLRPDLEPPIAVEHLVRTITSLLTFTPGRDVSRRDRRHYLRRTLVPVFVENA